MKFQTLCLIATACLAACNNGGSSGQISVKERKEIETEIASRIDDLRTAWANLDAPAVAAFYSEHGRDTYNGERVSFTGLMDWAAAGYAGITSTDIGEFQDYRVDVLAPNAVVVSWQNLVAEKATEHDRAARYIAFMTQVWIREDGEWRLLHNHESTLDLDASD